MKKSLLFGISLLFAAGITDASTLSPESALARLKNESGPAKLVSKGSTELRMTKYVDQKPVIYLFSRGDNAGFIAVSADDSSMPLLGYTDEGTFTGKESELPDGLRYWLQSLGEQIALNEGTYTPRKEAGSKTRIAPLTKTKWNQSAPYNDDCPELNGKRCVTGCVATALAQLLKYYSYPTQGTGSHSYDWTRGGKTLTFDYGSTTFDWGNMTNTYDDNSTDVQKAAVAQLMYACGVGVDMDYSTGGSGAADYYVLRTLIENLGYDPSVQYLLRDYYDLSDWENIVYDNLQNYGPVLYGGQSNDGGHEFICDGYQEGYFHFNWGWGGMSDGYFVLTALNPESQGIGGSTSGYNFSQDIIIGLQHGQQSTSVFQQIIWEGDFTITPSSVQLGNDVRYNGTFYNFSYAKIDGMKHGLLLTSSDGTKRFITDSKGVDLDPLSGYVNATFSVKLPQDIAAGTYTVQPAFTSTENPDPIIIPVKINNVGSYIMSVSGNTATFTAEEPAGISVSNFSLETLLYEGSDFKLTATLTNTSDSKEYYGEVAAVVMDGQTVVATGDPMQIDIPAGENTDWEYLSTLKIQSGVTITTGKTYKLYLCELTTVEQNGKSATQITRLSSAIDVTINKATTTKISVSSLLVENKVDSQLEGSATVTCSEGYFAGTLTLAIFNSNGGTSIATYNSDFFAVSANGNENTDANVSNVATIKFNASFDIGKPNTEYMAAVFKGQDQMSDAVLFTTSSTVAVDGITGETDVVNREYYTLTGIRLNERPVNPGIYVVREQHADGHVSTIKEAF